ncbi:MAG: Na+/H+ antiporter subunit C [Ignavibacteriaceae bacterium]|nr:Na+/H+ antiporter subunit C [Ignavibacteriaceae bacterium]
MILLLSILAGILVSAGIFLILRRSLVKIILGFALLTHAANLIIFTSGKITPGKAAFIKKGSESLSEPFADPVPQALILTAIVISFGITAFALVLFKKAYKATGSDDIDDYNTTDSIKHNI